MLTKFDAATITQKQLATVLDRDGYVILENALSTVELQSLQRELEPHFASRKDCQAHFYGFKTKRIEALFSKSKTAQALAIHPSVLQVANHVLGANCDNFQINLTQGIRINPGEKAQVLHPDSAMFPLPKKPFEFMVNALWAYSDFKKENGATQIVPGSHNWEEGRLPTPEEITYAEMKAGSVLIYAASLLHGGGANISKTSRTGITVSYCLGWLRQSENQYLSYTREQVQSFTPLLQNLLGYNVHRPNLGMVFGHNPIDLVNEVDHANNGAEDFLTEDQTALIQEFYESIGAMEEAKAA